MKDHKTITQNGDEDSGVYDLLQIDDVNGGPDEEMQESSNPSASSGLKGRAKNTKGKAKKEPLQTLRENLDESEKNLTAEQHGLIDQNFDNEMGFARVIKLM